MISRDDHFGDNHGEAGFTLIELLIGIALLAAIALVALPHARRATLSRTLDAAAADVSAVARMTRSTAIRTGSERTLVFDLDGRRYWADGVTGPRSIPPRLQLTLAMPPHARLNEPPHHIRFLPSGGSSGAEIVLDDGTRSTTVFIDWLTGGARVAP